MTADQPSPPDSLPKYIADGIPKQDTETLRNLQKWIDELLEYRADVVAEDIEGDSDQEIQDVDSSDGTTTVIKKVPCGKDACSTCPHGPYRYEVHREGGTLVWDYEGPVER